MLYGRHVSLTFHWITAKLHSVGHEMNTPLLLTRRIREITCSSVVGMFCFHKPQDLSHSQSG